MHLFIDSAGQESADLIAEQTLTWAKDAMGLLLPPKR